MLWEGGDNRIFEVPAKADPNSMMVLDCAWNNPGAMMPCIGPVGGVGWARGWGSGGVGWG